MVERPPLSASEQARLDTWAVDIAEEERGAVLASGEDYRIGDNRGLLIRANATWFDFASGSYGRGALTLLRYLRELELDQALGAAREWLADHAGNGRLKPGDDAEDGQANDDRERQVFIDAVWAGAKPVTGEPLPTAYFASRGLNPAAEDLAGMRWIPVTRGNEGGLLVAGTDTAGQLVAFQETCITPAGEKSTVVPARMTYRGPHDWARRSLVRFGDGEGEVYLCEGIEDALSIRAVGGGTVFACLGVAILGKAKMPPGVTRVIVVRDGDPDGSPADQSLWRGMVRLLGQGITVQVTKRPARVFGKDCGLKDANDVLQAHDVDGVKQLLDTAVAVSDEMSAEAVADEASRLSDSEYETARKRLAVMLGWRKGRLDTDRQERRKARAGAGIGGEAVNPDELPWPDSVPDIGEVLEIAFEKVKGYVAAQPADYITVVMWSVLAHLLYRKDLKLNIAPRLAIQSAVTISGKTTTLTVIRDLCPRSEMVGTSTLSPIMRCIGFLRPTLCIDEADNLLTSEVRADLLGLLNSGHNRAGAYALRSEYDEKNKTWIPVKLPTFAPIAFAGLRQLPETLQNRSLRIQLRRALPGEVRAHLSEEGCPVLVECRRKLLRWATDLTYLQDVTLPAELINRHGDNWRPLFRIAATVGGHWPARVLAAARDSSRVEEGGETIALLEAIWNVFNEAKVVRLRTDTLIEGLGNQDEGRWLQVNGGKRIDAYYLREQLKGVIPNTEAMRNARSWREKSTSQKGYTEAHFEDAWARYLLKEPPSVVNGTRKKHFFADPPDSSAASAAVGKTATKSKGNGAAHGAADAPTAADDPLHLHSSAAPNDDENNNKSSDIPDSAADATDDLGVSWKNKMPKGARPRRRKPGNGGAHPVK